MSLNFRQGIHYVRQLILQSETIIRNIPKSEDNTPTKIIKSLNLAERGYSYFFGESRPAFDYLDTLNIQTKVDMNFVNIFFDVLNNNYPFKSNMIDKHYSCIIIPIPDNGTLYFIDTSKSAAYSTKHAPTFGYSKGFDFNKLISSLWEKYNGKIYITTKENPFYSHRKLTKYTSLKTSNNQMYGKSIDLLKEIQNKNKQYKKNSIPKTYLFLGKPGTGKSSFAIKLAEEKDRIIKFDAKSFNSFDSCYIDFLLGGLKPNFIIIDDIDKVLYGSEISILLFILETIKLKFPDTIVILTANDLYKMDPALIRPGRVDEIYEFHCNPSDRKAIISGYLKDESLTLSKKELKLAVEATKGLSGAYLKEFVIQLKCTPFKDIINVFNSRRRLLGMFSEKENDDYHRLINMNKGYVKNNIESEMAPPLIECDETAPTVYNKKSFDKLRAELKKKKKK